MEQEPVFTIIIVCLNPGGKLKKTLGSIASQTFPDYEVIIKDGLSSDGAPEAWERENTDRRIRIFREKDRGIYDAMNQAAAKARGRFLYFLNCGDLFREKTVLEQVHKSIEGGSLQTETNQFTQAEAGKEIKSGKEIKTDKEIKAAPIPSPERLQILYGNIFETATGQQVMSNPRLDRFGCYRNVPCHQACFYKKELLTQHPFITKYRVRADYEHFLWCALKKNARLTYIPLTVTCYEGGGFSETKENLRLSAKEHREIVRQYMSRGELFRYRTILLLTLAPLRTALSRNKSTAALYNNMKKLLYALKHK